MKRFAIIMVFLTAALSGCGLFSSDVEWTEVRECTSNEMAFIDHSIHELGLVEIEVEGEINNDNFTFNDILSQLRIVQEDNSFRCGLAELTFDAENMTDGDIRSQANWHYDEIWMHVESDDWLRAFPSWLNSRGYGNLTDEDKIKIAASDDYETYQLLLDDAGDYLYEPSPVAGTLAHEAGHLFTGAHHSYDAEDIDDDSSAADGYLDDLHTVCDDAIFLEVYVPEYTWLEEIHNTYD
jgi:hypothetical protein